MKATRRRFLQTVFVSAVGSALAPGVLAQGRTRIRLAQPTDSLSYMAVFAARALKYFEDEGIDLEVVVTGGDGPDVQALVAGEVQFVVTPPSHLLTLHQQGRKLLGIAAVVGRLAINFAIRKDAAAARGITEKSPFAAKLKAFKGLKIGATVPGSLTFNIASHYIRRAGLTPQVDAQIVTAGAGPASIAAIENKVVDAYAYASPVIEQMIERGSCIMFINNTRGEDPEFSEFLHAVLYVRPDYAQQNADMVRRVTRAIVKGGAWVSRNKPEEIARVLDPFFGRISRSILLSSIANVKNAMVPTGRITPAMVKSMQRVYLETGTLKQEVPFDAVFTNDYLPA